MKPPFSWLTDSVWGNNPVMENVLISAAYDADVLKVKEKGGNNRGPRVREYLKAVGLGEGYAWCAAFVTFHFLQADGELGAIPSNGASACNWLRNAPPKYWEKVPSPSRGCIGGWCGKGWKGHLFLVVRVYRVAGILFMDTIEGNTGPDGGRDGDGVYRKRRRVTSKYEFIRFKR